MIRSINGILSTLGSTDNTHEYKRKVLMEWGKSIVEECESNFEYTMEITDSTGSGTTKIDIETPVLIKSTVLDVINKIE